MANLSIKTHSATVTPFPRAVPPMPAVARILARYDRDKLEAFISVAIDLIDTLDGPHDPDAPDYRRCTDVLPGDPDEGEHAGDERDLSWPDRFAQDRQPRTWAQRTTKKTTLTNLTTDIDACPCG